MNTLNLDSQSVAVGCHVAHNLAPSGVTESVALVDPIGLKQIASFASIPPLEAHARVQKGIPLSEVSRFARALNLTQDELSGLLGVPVRTLQRWLAESGKKLDPSTGGRYYRTVKVLQQSCELLGSLPAALQWLRSEQRALGFRVPFELLATDPGAEAVEDLLGRIEYGVIT